MLIISKSKARAKAVKNETGRFDLGKYKWDGSIKHYYGMEVPDIPGVVAVYPEQRKDKDGPYVALICVK